jgi:hypothetical protein
MDGGVSCGPVATFGGSPSLASSVAWQLDTVEVWKVANPPEPHSQELRKLIHRKAKARGGGDGDGDGGTTSILSTQQAKEAMADLAIAGRTFYSTELAPPPLSPASVADTGTH